MGLMPMDQIYTALCDYAASNALSSLYSAIGQELDAGASEGRVIRAAAFASAQFLRVDGVYLTIGLLPDLDAFPRGFQNNHRLLGYRPTSDWRSYTLRSNPRMALA